MCASYGLQIDPHGYDYLDDTVDPDDARRIRAWAEANTGRTLQPTGIKERRLLPIITDEGYEEAWWGHLVKGRPAPYPSINTRSERLLEKPGLAAGRALVPATTWYEMQKPSRQWYAGRVEGEQVFMMAAVTRPGTPEGGDPVTCYSIVMREAEGENRAIHDRIPLILPPDQLDLWIGDDHPTRDLIEEALAAGTGPLEHATYDPRATSPLAKGATA